MLLPLLWLLGCEREPPPPWNWGIPACAVGYEWTALAEERPAAGGPAPATAHLSGTAQGRLDPKTGNWELKSGPVRMVSTRGGAPVPDLETPAGALAPALLRPENGSLTEISGPTALWSAMGTFPGLTIFWPTLPREEEEPTPWTLTLHPRASSLAAEAARGSLKLPPGYRIPPAAPATHPATITWREGEDPAVRILEGGWTVSQDDTVEEPALSVGGEPPAAIRTRTAAQGQYQGRWLVHPAGELLSAEISGQTDVRITLENPGQPPQTLQTVHTLKAEIKRLPGCEPPALAEE